MPLNGLKFLMFGFKMEKKCGRPSQMESGKPKLLCYFLCIFENGRKGKKGEQKMSLKVEALMMQKRIYFMVFGVERAKMSFAIHLWKKRKNQKIIFFHIRKTLSRITTGPFKDQINLLQKTFFLFPSRTSNH